MHAQADDDTSPSMSDSDSQSDDAVINDKDDEEKNKNPVKKFFFRESNESCKHPFVCNKWFKKYINL